MGKIIAVAMPKGGVGKTTTAVNLAIELSKKNRKTLLIDADPSNQCALSFGFHDEIEIGTLYDVISYISRFDQAINQTDNPYLDVLPFKELTYEDELIIADISFDQFLLKNLLHPVLSGYDYIIIDCPPYLLGMTSNVLNIADSVILPVKASMLSIEPLKKMIDRILTISQTTNNKLKIEGILLTMYEFNSKAAFNAKKLLYSLYPNNIFTSAIPKNVISEEASFYHKPVTLFDSNAKSSKAYFDLASEIIENNSKFTTQLYDTANQADF